MRDEYPTRKQPGSSGGGGGAVAAAGVALVVESYMFSVQPGPGGHELPVCRAFWSGLLAANPKAWFVFVEGTISKKLWATLNELFQQAGEKTAHIFAWVFCANDRLIWKHRAASCRPQAGA